MAIKRYGQFSLDIQQPIDAATVEELRLGLDLLKFISPGVLAEGEDWVPLVEEDPVFIDLGAGKNFSLTLTDDREMDSPLDQMPGRSGRIIVTQGGAGGYDLTWHSDWKVPGDLTPTIRGGVGETTGFTYRVVDVGNVILEKEPEFASLADLLAGLAQDKLISAYNVFESMAEVVLVDGATIIPDLNEGLSFALTITDDRHISNPVGQRKGKSGRFYIRQDDDGGHSVTWGTDWKFVGGVVPSVPITPGAWTYVPYEVREPGYIISAAVDPFAGGGGGGEAVPAASVAEVRSAAGVSKYINPSALSSLYTPYTLTSGTSVLPDMDLGLNFILTLGHNATIQNMSHQRLGNGGFIVLIQGGSGGYTVTWDTNYVFLGGTPTIPTGAGDWTIIEYRVQAFGVIRCTMIPTSGIPQAASVADLWAGTDTGKFVTPGVAREARVMVALVDGPTIPINLNAGINFKVTVGGDRAFSNPTNQVAGKEGLIRIKQDGVGGRTISWGDQYVYEGDAPAIGADPDETSVVPYHVEEAGKVIVG